VANHASFGHPVGSFVFGLTVKMEGFIMVEFFMPKSIPDLKRWLGIRQGQGAGYYNGLKKAQLQAMYYEEIRKHKGGEDNAKQ